MTLDLDTYFLEERTDYMYSEVSAALSNNDTLEME